MKCYIDLICTDGRSEMLQSLHITIWKMECTLVHGIYLCSHDLIEQKKHVPPSVLYCLMMHVLFVIPLAH